MYVISLANEKGGVAKTTSAISLAAILAERKNRVLLIDLDPLACLTASLGLSIKDHQLSIGEILLDHIHPTEAILHTEIPGLDIIPAKESLGKIEKILPDINNYVFALKNTIEKIYSLYDFVVLDCPPFLGAITVNAMVASHLLLVPTQAEYFGIHGLRNLFDKLKIIRSSANSYLKSRIFITFYNDRNKVNHMLKDQLSNRLTETLLQSVITMDTKLRESQVCGEPITRYAPRSRGAKQYEILLDEVLQVLSPNSH
jgi:chromosome partitioning protein